MRRRKRNPGPLVLPLLLGGAAVLGVGGLLLLRKKPEPLALPITVNPDGSAHVQGTAFVFSSNGDAAAAVAEANRRGITVQQLLSEEQR